MNEEDRCSWEKARFIGPSSIGPSTKQETSEIQSVSNSSSIPTERTNKNKPKNSDTIKRTNENKKPKRPVTAYIFFAKKMRSLIQSSNPEMTGMYRSLYVWEFFHHLLMPSLMYVSSLHLGLDITKEIAKLWSRTEENERVPYDKLEAKSRKNYFKEMKQWREDREDRISFSELNRKKQSLTVGIDLTKEESDKPNSKLQEKPKQRSTDPPVHKHAGQSAGQQRSNAAFDQHSDQHHSMGYQHPPYSHSNQYMMNPAHIPPFQYGQGAHMGNPSTMSYHGPNVPNFNGPMSGPPMNVPPMNVPPMNVPAPISKIPLLSNFLLITLLNLFSDTSNTTGYYSNLNSGPASHNFPHNP